MPLRHLIALIINAHPLGVALAKKDAGPFAQPDIDEKDQLASRSIRRSCGQAGRHELRPRRRIFRCMAAPESGVARSRETSVPPERSERSPLHDVRYHAAAKSR
jgi:hypothetical protein